MLPFAPYTRLINWLTHDYVFGQINSLRPSPLGETALSVALVEIGCGEEGGNNRGPHIERYRGARGGKGSWCAAFVSYCLLTAAKRKGIVCPVKPSNGARRLYRRCVAAGQIVSLDKVRAGDIVLWSRGPTGSWKAHIGIVSRVNRDRGGEVVGFQYVAGNEGKYPAKVREFAGIKKKRRVGFARLP